MVELLDQSENDFAAENPKLAELLNTVIDEIEVDKTKYVGQDISVIINRMRFDAIDKEIQEYAKKWYIDPEDVKYEAFNYRDGIVANENNLKDKADYTSYKEKEPNPMAKFKFRKVMIDEFKYELMPSIYPLIK